MIATPDQSRPFSAMCVHQDISFDMLNDRVGHRSSVTITHVSLFAYFTLEWLVQILATRFAKRTHVFGRPIAKHFMSGSIRELACKDMYQLYQ